MDSLMAVEIKQALEREFDVVLTAQELRNLTFGRLQELTDSGGKCDKPIQNLLDSPSKFTDIRTNMLLRSLGNEETANQIIIPLNDTNIECDTCVMFIPGVEGVSSPVLQKMSENIEVPVYALQLHAYSKEESLSNLISSVSPVNE